MNPTREKLNDLDLVQRRRWITLAVLCVSLMVIVLDNTILNVALPTLAKPHRLGGIGASASQQQWIVDAYIIVFAGLLLTAGSLGDRFGRYRALAGGLAVFGTGSALSAFTKSPDALITTRALMGIGGAFIMPSTLSILTNVFRDPKERLKAIGLWAGVAGLSALGPVTGGALLSHFWWGSVFLVNVPIVVGGLVAGYFFVPDSLDPAKPRLDPVGAVLSMIALGLLLWSVIEAPSHGWGSTSIVTGFITGAVVLSGFIAWELHTPSPMLQMQFFRNRRFSAASGAITLTFFSLFGILFILTQYLQIVLGFSPVKAGALLLPQGAVMLVFAPLSSVWVGRLGNKVVVAVGLVIVATSLVMLTAVNEHTTAVILVAITAVMGLGMANVMAPATDSIMGSLPRAKAGVGSAVNDTTRQSGGAVGVAVLGSVLASRYRSTVVHILGRNFPFLAGARDNVAAAKGFALANPALTSPAGRPAQARILQAANASFVSGMHVAAAVGAATMAVTAVMVVLTLPARAPDEADGGPVEEPRRQPATPVDGSSPIPVPGR
jgi:EmrB/QacA subfamily drug resistance transporter